MAEAFPDIVARGAARQVYRLLRLSAPILRPISRRIGLHWRANAVTNLVRIGWNDAPLQRNAAGSLDIAPPDHLRPGVVCIGHPRAESGVGEALRATARGFDAASVPFGLAGLDGLTTARLEDASMQNHVTTSLGRCVNLICDGLIGAEVTVDALGPDARAGRYNIFRPFWELARVPPRFAPMLAKFDEIWAPSDFVRDAFASCVDVPVLRMPLPVELGPIAPVTRAEFGLPEKATLFLFAFDPSSFVARKNPRGVIEAFHKAFGRQGRDNVGLVIKSLSAGPHASALEELRAASRDDPRIHLIERTLSRSEMNGLLAACDAFVSLHRAEGFGFGLAEAMALGKPVIGTAYSGSADFLNETTGYPVPYKLVPVKRGEYPDHQDQVWAEPDIAAAAEHLKAIVNNPAGAKARGGAGQVFIKTHHSAGVAGRLMRDRLAALGLLKASAPATAVAGS